MLYFCVMETFATSLQIIWVLWISSGLSGRLPSHLCYASCKLWGWQQCRTRHLLCPNMVWSCSPPACPENALDQSPPRPRGHRCCLGIELMMTLVESGLWYSKGKCPCVILAERHKYALWWLKPKTKDETTMVDKVVSQSELLLEYIK